MSPTAAPPRSTADSTPRLSDVARHLVIPEGVVTSVFPRVEQRLSKVGLSFDRWQQGFGTVALGCREDGKYAATVGGNVASICRQTGKTFTVGGIHVGLCLEFPGFRAAWTSHHNRTTTNTFRSLQGLVKRKRIWPHVDAIRTTNGEQEITFKNGSVIMFGAREQGFGRGMDAIDSIVFDEAQILSLKALEDMVPAANQARNPHGGLVWFMGTPPRPTDDGEAFTAKREQALSGRSKNIAYVELSADPDSDPDDQSQWPIMNPSFPYRTPLEAMLRMRENIPDEDSWNREARGIWPEVTRHAPIVAPSVWKALTSSGPPDGTKPDALGVDMSHGGDISIVGCWNRDDGSVHVEEVFAGASTAAAVDFIAAVADRKMPVVIDRYSQAAQMYDVLRARKFLGAVRTSNNDMAPACAQFLSRVNAGTFRHDGEKSLTDAVMGARKRLIGDAGGFGWDRKDSTVSIHPLVAATMALLGASRVNDGNPSGAGDAFFL